MANTLSWQRGWKAVAQIHCMQKAIVFLAVDDYTGQKTFQFFQFTIYLGKTIYYWCFKPTSVFSLNFSEVHESNCTDLVLFLFQGKDPRQPFSSSISRRQSAAWEPRFLPSEQQRVQLTVPVGQHTRQNWLVLCSLTPLCIYWPQEF